jgi:hypothetical protein
MACRLLNPADMKTQTPLSLSLTHGLYQHRALAVAGAFVWLALASSCAPPGDNGLTVSEESTHRKGIDYAWGRPRPSTLRADGYTFAARYLSYDTTGKNLTRGEADALRAAGVDVVANWEWGATDALRGFDEGASEAREAERQANDCGIPAGRPIYFSVDFDATPGDQAAINSYFDGVASVLGRERTGAYGGYWVISRLFDAHKIQYGWQTYAWSGGNWDSRAQMQQYNNGIVVDGVGSDQDRSVAADFGQWGYRAKPADQLVDVHSGKCMDVEAQGTADGTKVQLYGCNHTGAQSMSIEPIGADVRIVNTHSGKCIDVTGDDTVDGTKIELWTCSGLGSQTFEKKDDGHGGFNFVHKDSGKCIDVTGWGTTDGTQIQLWTCTGNTNQQWKVEAQ